MRFGSKKKGKVSVVVRETRNELMVTAAYHLTSLDQQRPRQVAFSMARIRSLKRKGQYRGRFKDARSFARVDEAITRLRWGARWPEKCPQTLAEVKKASEALSEKFISQMHALRSLRTSLSRQKRKKKKRK